MKDLIDNFVSVFKNSDAKALGKFFSQKAIITLDSNNLEAKTICRSRKEIIKFFTSTFQKDPIIDVSIQSRILGKNIIIDKELVSTASGVHKTNIIVYRIINNQIVKMSVFSE